MNKKEKARLDKQLDQIAEDLLMMHIVQHPIFWIAYMRDYW